LAFVLWMMMVFHEIGKLFELVTLWEDYNQNWI